MSLVIHPEYKRLKDNLSNLLIEEESLLSQICPEIERKYLINFGFLEFELYKKDTELSKIKRKLQLIQIQINNEKEIDIEAINKKLNEEFREYEQNIKKQMDDLNSIMGETPHYLSKDDAKRLKLIYKQCVLKLHPDLNQNQTDYEKQLFVLITDAFKCGDLKKMESLYYIIPESGMEQVSEIDRLKELIRDVEERIMEIKSNYPYNKKELLNHDESINEYKHELNELIKQFGCEITRYENKILELI